MTVVRNEKQMHISNRRRRLVHFLVIYLLILIISVAFHTTDQHCDAGGYYGLSLIFKESGLFNISQFHETFRGYFFPWFIAIMNFGDLFGIHGFVFTLPLFFSLIFSIILPAIFDDIFSIKVKLYQELITTVLFLFIFKGLLIYTLSDFYAFGFCLIAIYFINKSMQKTNFKVRSIICWLIAGVSSYAAYNTRTIYMLFIILLIFVIIIEGIVHRNKQVLFGIPLFVFGMFMLSIPQIMINLNSLNVFSPKVITGGTDNNLFLFQLQAGLHMKKYETFIGHSLHDLQGLSFYDRGIFFDMPIYTFADYFQAVIAHPISYIKLLFVHLFNMIDMRYPDAYIKTFVDTTFVQVVNYIAISLSLTSLIQKLKDNTVRLSKRIYQSRYILVLLLCSLCIVPGAVETRFSLPILILLWCFGFYHFRFPKKEDSKKTTIIYILIFVVIFIILLAASTQAVYPTLSNLELYR